MKQLLILLLGVFTLGNTYGQGYNIEVKINGLTCTDTVLLANHFGEQQFLKDTAVCKGKNTFVFKGEKILKNGVYLVVLPRRVYFEVILDEKENQKQIKIEADTSLNPLKLKSSGSKNIDLFIAFNVFAQKKGGELQKLRKEYKEANDDEKENVKDQIIELNKSVVIERGRIANTYPELFIGTLYKSMMEVHIPEAPIKEDGTIDSFFQARYKKNHYWDNIDFSEDGLVRSPVFHNKLKTYFSTYLPPLPDTAIAELDRILDKMDKKGSKEQYKYTIHWATRHYEKSKYMCMDNVLFHMLRNYYCAGKAFWADTATVRKYCEYVEKNDLIQCGEVAPDMNMPDTSFTVAHRVSDIKSEITILLFWDHECGHCKKEIPIIKKYIEDNPDLPVTIYSIYTQGDWDGWKKYLKANKLPWLNVGNAFGDDDFRKHYNIVSTPQLYVLDENKVIRFKKVGADNLAQVIKFMMENKKRKDKEALENKGK